jgi:hypothetical protein
MHAIPHLIPVIIAATVMVAAVVVRLTLGSPEKAKTQTTVQWVGATDIAYTSNGDTQASNPIPDKFPGAAVYTTGDNAYYSGCE